VDGLQDNKGEARGNPAHSLCASASAAADRADRWEGPFSGLPLHAHLKLQQGRFISASALFSSVFVFFSPKSPTRHSYFRSDLCIDPLLYLPVQALPRRSQLLPRLCRPLCHHRSCIHSSTHKPPEFIHQAALVKRLRPLLCCTHTAHHTFHQRCVCLIHKPRFDCAVQRCAQ
jgi:hypothetical protein